MITLSEFISKWTGKGIDFDGHYGFQCVDLYRQYVQEVLGVPQSPGVAGAKDIWDSYLTEYYERIANTPEGIPQPGDIMIWGANYGPYGHVAVVTTADTKTFTCFSQNDPAGALPGLKTYSNWQPTLGWLHPKEKTITYKGYNLNNVPQESMKVMIDALTELQTGQLVRKADVDQITKDLNQKIVDQATQYANEKAIKDEQIKALEESLAKLQDTEHTWQDQADVYQRKLKAIVDEFSKVDIQVAVEMDENVLVNTLHSYLTDNEANRAFVTSVMTTPYKTPVDVLGALESVEELNKMINYLTSENNRLKKKETAFRTVNLPGIIIKFYKK